MAIRINILGAGKTFINEAGGQEKTLPTLLKSLSCARVQYKKYFINISQMSDWS